MYIYSNTHTHTHTHTCTHSSMHASKHTYTSISQNLAWHIVPELIIWKLPLTYYPISDDSTQTDWHVRTSIPSVRCLVKYCVVIGWCLLWVRSRPEDQLHLRPSNHALESTTHQMIRRFTEGPDCSNIIRIVFRLYLSYEWCQMLHTCRDKRVVNTDVLLSSSAECCLIVH